MYLKAPSSPSTQRKLLYANRGLKTGSVDLPDDIEKSLSSASTSPCPSPVSKSQVHFFKLNCILLYLLFSIHNIHTLSLQKLCTTFITIVLQSLGYLFQSSNFILESFLIIGFAILSRFYIVFFVFTFSETTSIVANKLVRCIV